jgi:glycosyltransferase involved in cell wall biosynthesis
MLVAKRMGFQFATTVQGSDVNVFFQNPTRKRQILQALRASRAVFCRSEALREKLHGEGIEATTVYNGINRELFYPRDRAECCRQLGLDSERKRVLFVGNMLPVKGPTVLAEAFSLFRHPERSEGSSHNSGKVLRSAQNDNNVEPIFIGNGTERITSGRCVGARPHHEIPIWMNASDVLCLPSLNEGLPNVALEAMACGLPVVASRVGGVPEIVNDSVNGFMVPAGEPVILADRLREALDKNWDRNAIRASIAAFDWTTNAQTVLTTLKKCSHS